MAAMTGNHSAAKRVGAQIWRPSCAGIIAILLAIVAAQPLPEGSEEGGTPEVPAELTEALSEIDSGEAEAQAEAVAGEQGLYSAATPCTMRHSRVAPGVDRALRHRLAAATLATGAALKESLLDDLEASTSPGAAAWRVALARAELALRDGRAASAISHLDRAAKTDMPDWCRGDEFFLRATATTNQVEAAALLDAAVAADPGFWAAQERLAILAAGGTGNGAASCGRNAARTIRATLQLGALATSDSQFERLERAVIGLEPNGRTALLHGMILRQTGRTEAARDRWSKALATLGSGDCDSVLRVAIERMLQNTREDRP